MLLTDSASVGRKLTNTCVVGVLAIISLSSCDQNRYEIKEDKAGRMVRLDRRTGEITVLEGDKLVKLKDPDAQRMENTLVERLASPKVWPEVELPQLDKSKVTLKTLWRNGHLHYQFSLAPEPKPVRERAIVSFTVAFMDASGFKTLEIDLPLQRLTRIVNDKSETTSMDLDDSVPCSQDQYERSLAWTVRWRTLR